MKEWTNGALQFTHRLSELRSGLVAEHRKQITETSFKNYNKRDLQYITFKIIILLTKSSNYKTISTFDFITSV